MEEKIKIYVPEAINNILLNDMEKFEIFKKDGSLNKNEFYNTLIVNYYEQFGQKQSSFFSYIKDVIDDNTNASKIVASDIASNILKYVDNSNYQLDNQKANVTISFKPTKVSAETISFIEDYYIKDTTLSSYFRNMFASYTLLPQDKRERIIFKKNFELIEEAIANNKKLYFTTTKNSNSRVVSPYSIANSKEELFNYLLAEQNDRPYSYRISRLKKLSILNEHKSISDNNIRFFKLMEKYGPQFIYNTKKELGDIKIRLTDEGKRLYRNSYVHRPKYSKVEGDIYYFECSFLQIINYFARFGKDAIIISPDSLKEEMCEYYKESYKAYNSKK